MPFASTNPARPAETVELPPAEVRTFTFPNGLTLLVKEDARVPVASVQFWVQTGSVHEDQHLGAGISHLLEHMLFKGSETRSRSEFALQVQDAGGYLNAYTSFDRTVYWIDIPAKGVETALELLADAIFHSTLPADEFVKEQEVIRREFAMGEDDPDRMIGHALFAAAYQSHPYRHPVIGHLSAFNRLTRDDVMAYYKARYVPNNIFIVVAGNVQAERMREVVERHCAKEPWTAMSPVYIAPEPPQLGRRDAHTEFPTELTRMHLSWHTPDAAHADLPALDLLSEIMGGGRSSRLYRRLREEARLVHSVDAWCFGSTHPGLWGVDALLDPDKREAVEAEVLRALQEVHESGVTPAELAKAKRQSLSSHLQGLTTTRAQANEIGSDWLIARSCEFSRAYLHAIQSVTAEEIRAVIGRYLVDRNLTAVSLNPPGSVPRKAAAAPVQAATEIQRFTLPNGLRLLVREDPRLPLVSISAVFKAGLLAETPANQGISRLLAKTLVKGTKNRTAEQLADEIEAVGGSISSDAGNNSLTVFTRVMRPDRRLGLEIVADVLLNATLPEKAIAREKEVQLAGIKAEEEEIDHVAQRLLSGHLMAGHPYSLRHLGTPESVTRITQADLSAFREQYIVGKNGVISVFGDVKAEEIRALVEETLGALPAGEEAFTAPPQPAPLAEPRLVEEHMEKTQAVLRVGYRGVDLFSPDRTVLQIIDEASSDLGSRFFVRIRDQMGLAYSVGAFQMYGLAPGMFVFYLATDPLKVTAVQAELMAEIRQLAEEGLTAAELHRAKEKLLGQQDIRQQSNDSFGFATALDELYGLGFDHYRELRAEVENTTLEDTRRVARKYFREQPALTVIVRPAPSEGEAAG